MLQDGPDDSTAAIQSLTVVPLDEFDEKVLLPKQIDRGYEFYTKCGDKNHFRYNLVDFCDIKTTTVFVVTIPQPFQHRLECGWFLQGHHDLPNFALQRGCFGLQLQQHGF